MATVTIGFGILLIGIGLGGYLGTDRVSVTALIPAFFGLPLVLLGLLALKDSLRKHAMHAAAMVGLLGFVGGVVRLVKPVSTMLSGGEVEHRVAVLMTGLMTLCCGVFLALCVKSFIDARRRRAQQV